MKLIKFILKYQSFHKALKHKKNIRTKRAKITKTYTMKHYTKDQHMFIFADGTIYFAGTRILKLFTLQSTAALIVDASCFVGNFCVEH